MADIKRIDVRLATGRQNSPGTDGDVYLGICGREFYIDSAGDFNDFESGGDKTYTFGEGANVKFADINNPQSPFKLKTERLDGQPVYIRFAPKDREDRWNLSLVTVTVNPGQTQIQYQALSDADNLWLGTNAGLFCGLQKL